MNNLWGSVCLAFRKEGEKGRKELGGKNCCLLLSGGKEILSALGECSN